MPNMTPELLLHAYASGVFPMAESRDDDSLYWVDPDERGIIPLDGLRISRSLRKTIRKGVFEVRCDTAFEEVVRGCAEATEDRKDTWINSEIFELYSKLFQMGFAHSIECWVYDELVGGLYGVSLQGAFFGESMFSRMTDASKVALIHLVSRLKISGFSLLDTQFVTDHLVSLGAQEISRDEYLKQLSKALNQNVTFYSGSDSSVLSASLETVIAQSKTQTS
ncbi:MAG: leucyl/phenylalanyl-tRNA--protein transferase [Rhodospirillales bacterium]|nr:leucyl/phenylalanyl-tRNA--protein transferase [Rhodospirillales bacterium]